MPDYITAKKRLIYKKMKKKVLRAKENKRKREKVRCNRFVKGKSLISLLEKKKLLHIFTSEIEVL